MLATAGSVMGIIVFLATRPVASMLACMPTLRDETALVLLAMIGGIVYVGLIAALLGRRWLAGFAAASAAAAIPPPKS
jgi:hypothetical protein